jgi:hypothetical protein
VREADLVAQVKTLEGEPELLLVHLEVQANRERDFEASMYEYYALLWLRHRLPILPIVVYLAGGSEGTPQEIYRVSLLGREVLTFTYECVRLPALDAGQFATMENPLAAALAALMARSAVSDSLILRAVMLKRIARSGLDDARKFLLLNLVETYFALAGDEADAFSRLLARAEFREVPEMQVTWADRMKEEGRKAGREEGREEGWEAGALEAKREILLRQLTRKFGPLPEELTARVMTLPSAGQLDAYLDRLLTARSLEEMGLEG